MAANGNDVKALSLPLRCELKNVVKTYRSGEIVCPINGISLQCGTGDFVSIEGPSGIGKSTLLYLIGGLLRADSGGIWLNVPICKSSTTRPDDFTRH